MSQSVVKLPEDVVVTQGERSYNLYFVTKGKLTAEIIDFANRKHKTNDITEGHLFGEISYILKSRRTATVTCLDYVCLLCMP